MPLHDWTHDVVYLFHDFHQTWTIHLKAALNSGLLPKGLSALIEPKFIPIEENYNHIDRTNCIAIRRHLTRLVAFIEIVSPESKRSRAEMCDFLARTMAFLRRGVHLLILDLFPPSPRDPFGIHKAIWDEIEEEDFVFPPGKDRILASYETGNERAAFIEPVAVGDTLPSMPLFVARGVHVRVPLEDTYQSTWQACPEEMRLAVETGVLPDPDAEGD